MSEATPTQEAIAAGTKTVEIEDKATKRKIVLRKPSVLAQYRLIETLGNERASNQTYVLMVMPLMYVVSIDDLPVPPMVKHSEIEALIQRLDESGVAAVSEAVLENWGQAKSPDETKDTLKK